MLLACLLFCFVLIMNKSFLTCNVSFLERNLFDIRWIFLWKMYKTKNNVLRALMLHQPEEEGTRDKNKE